MSWGLVAVAGASVVGGMMSADAQGDAAAQAAAAQGQASEAGIAEQRRQFDALQKLLQPYVEAGTGALGAQQNLIGLGGAGQQQEAINALQNSPQFAAMIRQGENALLQNASATGGLRGGNLQGALAQFRPNLLAQTISDQYARLGGMTSLGQNAAAGVGNAGMTTGTNIANLLQQQGAAQAGGYLAAGKAEAGMWNAPAQGLGTYFGLGGGKVFGMTGAKF